MTPRLGIPYALTACCGILIITGSAKLVTLFSPSAPLASRDPILGITNRLSLSLLSVIEFTLTSAIVAFPHSRRVLISLLAFAAGGLAYRLMAKILEVKGSCPCLGIVNSWLPIPAEILNILLMLGLLFLFAVALAEIKHGRYRSSPPAVAGIPNCPVPLPRTPLLTKSGNIPPPAHAIDLS